mmetsp:Transcript_3613/g.5861  ORF Transcript_3613/g.5861 Transcript_3613/m.5861 type:complete len:89 (+) Transcript_3613:360-626(+)
MPERRITHRLSTHAIPCAKTVPIRSQKHNSASDCKLKFGCIIYLVPEAYSSVQMSTPHQNSLLSLFHRGGQDCSTFRRRPAHLLKSIL